MVEVTFVETLFPKPLRVLSVHTPLDKPRHVAIGWSTRRALGCYPFGNCGLVISRDLTRYTKSTLQNRTLSRDIVYTKPPIKPPW